MELALWVLLAMRKKVIFFYKYEVALAKKGFQGCQESRFQFKKLVSSLLKKTIYGLSETVLKMT